MNNDENQMSDELDNLIQSWRDRGAGHEDIISALELATMAAREQEDDEAMQAMLNE